MTFVISKQQGASSADQRGLGLIELMVALVIGLLVTGSAVAIFASNSQTYAAAESLGRIQENSRTAYELMARDLRAAGGTPCATKDYSVANVTFDRTASAGKWWQAWSKGAGIVGYSSGDTDAPANMKAGTNAILMMSADDSATPIVSHNPTAGNFTLNVAPTNFNALDIAVICDYRQASVFQVGSVTTATRRINYVTGGLNCTSDLSMPTNCSSTNSGIQYANGAMLSRLRAVQWYIGQSKPTRTYPDGTPIYSLFALRRLGDGTFSEDEVAEGVNDMQLTYLKASNTDYVNAAAIAGDWANVIAVRVSLTLQGGEGQQHVSTVGGALTRQLNHTVAIRNHSK